MQNKVVSKNSITVTSAIPLSSEDKNLVEKYIQNKEKDNADIIFVTDKNSGGGIKIEARGWMLDMTLLKQLRDLVQNLKK